VIPSNRIADFPLGISILGWAAAGTWSNLGQRPAAVLLATSLLHVIVGVLFLIRGPAERQGSVRTCLVAIPAVLVGGWVFRFAPHAWSVMSQVIFVSGSGLALLSFAFLGRCFSILPAVRGTVTAGPFSCIRHPAYLGELTMVAGCVVAAPLHWSQLPVMAIVGALVAARIFVEEQLLLTGAAYRNYCHRVPWRLIPFVW